MGGGLAWGLAWLVFNLAASWAQENGGFEAHLDSFLLQKSRVLLRRTELPHMWVTIPGLL